MSLLSSLLPRPEFAQYEHILAVVDGSGARTPPLSLFFLRRSSGFRLYRQHGYAETIEKLMHLSMHAPSNDISDIMPSEWVCPPPAPPVHATLPAPAAYAWQYPSVCSHALRSAAHPD